jgi:hypothetical protein
MIDEPPERFLMTPAQHRQWARILHSKGKPEKAGYTSSSRAQSRSSAGGSSRGPPS